MEMKYFVIALALVASLATADLAQARGRRGCASCGSCPGGVCDVKAAPAPVQKASTEAPQADAAVAAAPAPASQTYASTNVRRFGFRRR